MRAREVPAGAGAIRVHDDAWLHWHCRQSLDGFPRGGDIRRPTALKQYLDEDLGGRSAGAESAAIQLSLQNRSQCGHGAVDFALPCLLFRELDVDQWQEDRDRPLLHDGFTRIGEETQSTAPVRFGLLREDEAVEETRRPDRTVIALLFGELEDLGWSRRQSAVSSRTAPAATAKRISRTSCRLADRDELSRPS